MDYLHLLVTRYPQLEPCRAAVASAFDVLCQTYDQDGTLLICGNGVSASDDAHIGGEVMKSFVGKREVGTISQRLREQLPLDEAEYLTQHLQGALRAISLQSQSALISAFANDVSADLVYAQQVLGYGRPGDSLIAISTSGNSKNVVHAVQVAHAAGLHTIGLCGENGGRLKQLCDVCICVPACETYMVQELHLPVYHTLCLMLEQRFFGGERNG